MYWGGKAQSGVLIAKEKDTISEFPLSGPNQSALFERYRFVEREEASLLPLPAPGQPLIRMRFSSRSFAFLWPATASRRNRWRFSNDSPSPISKASSNLLSLFPRGDCPMIASYTETKSSRHLRRTISTRSMNLLSSILLPQEISDIYVQRFVRIWSNFTFHVYEILWQMEKVEQYVRGTIRVRSMNLLSKIIPYVPQEISTNGKVYSSSMEFYEPALWIERYL